MVMGISSKDKWVKIGKHRRAGILVPLFSIYSKNSTGIGDFQDLKLLIDWSTKTGNSIIQLLPMNEVGSLFCPYDSISSFALEPMYISLEALQASGEKFIRKRIEDIRKKFPTGKPYVDYGIKKEKIQLLWEIYLKEKYLDSSVEFLKFKEENTYWLLDFALYKVLKDYHQGRAWYEWEPRYKNRDMSALEELQNEYKREIEFQMWLQWLLYEQFKKVKTYAFSKRILLKGDLPILVSRDSANVWQHPEYFKLEFASGAPPDMYAALGQRWGMPTHNWEKIAADDYRYAKEKLRYAENFYDILRIDHVVGLFRIWSIPYNERLENQGLNGFFDPRDENRWEGHGRTLLSIINNNTNMLICAEDLGIIPKVCPKALEEFAIPGNDVERWVKDWKVKHDFLDPKDYRFLSVAMLSTHDTTNWPAWWEYEAGTVDEKLFTRKCNERGIDYFYVKAKLFDVRRSYYGRLRWLDSIDLVEKLVGILGKRKEELMDFIEIYENSYQEKEKLWKHLGITGAMREICDPEIIKAALRITLDSRSVFCINTLMDWLFLGGVFKGNPYQFRINAPGTISEKNWSLVMPISLEKLLNHPVSKIIKEMTITSGRVFKF